MAVAVRLLAPAVLPSLLRPGWSNQVNDPISLEFLDERPLAWMSGFSSEFSKLI